jgi:2-methylcitrate dehydratase PrpD
VIAPCATTGLEAKFSLRFITAAALLRADASSLETYQDANVRDAALCGLRDRVTVEFVKAWPYGQLHHDGSDLHNFAQWEPAKALSVVLLRVSFSAGQPHRSR